ncbi:MAG: GNAT family N-acetyltransferase [Pseudomonadota bacterium]
MTEALSITTERLRLRPIAPEDFPHWRAFYATDHSRFVGGPKSEEDAWWKLTQFVGDWAMSGHGFWSVETKDGDYLGRVGLEIAPNWTAPELGWSFLPEAGGKGYATEAAAAVRAHERRRMGYDEVHSFIHPDNEASARVAQRLGAAPDVAIEAPWAEHVVYRHPPEAA